MADFDPAADLSLLSANRYDARPSASRLKTQLKSTKAIMVRAVHSGQAAKASGWNLTLGALV
jgi:hypothetical protein